jgi:hypothetical protein
MMIAHRDDVLMDALERIAYEQIEHPYPPEYEGGFRAAKNVIVETIDDESCLDEWEKHHTSGWVPMDDKWWLPDE